MTSPNKASSFRVLIFNLFTLILIASNEAKAFDAWIPPEGDSQIFTSFVYDSGDTFFRAQNRDSLPFGNLEQSSCSLGASDSPRDSVAIDFSLGYTRTDSDNELGSEEGLDDSRVGVRIGLLDEFEYDNLTPTVSLELVSIIKGTYDADVFPIAPGDGASGIECSILFGKLWGDGNYGNYSKIGYRQREGSVPEDFLFSFGFFANLSESITTSIGYTREQALSGSDLVSSEVSAPSSRFLREIIDEFDFSLGYTTEQNWFLGLVYGLTVDGRNTLERDYFGVTLSAPLGNHPL